MALRLGGVFIQAIVERGNKSFDPLSETAFRNSLSSISITTAMGQSSQIEVELSPTFPQAVRIIESGYLGFGFPMQKAETKSVESNLTEGVQAAASDQGSNTIKASTLAVRMGYGDGGVREEIATTPWTYGIIQAPNLSFGSEISITLKAVSMGVKLASSDTTRTFEGESLYSVVKRLIEEDIKGEVEFKSQAAARAQQIKVNRNQSDNTMAFLKDLLSDYNFKFYESGGTTKNPKQMFMIDDLAGISNQKANFTLRMYGQIDVSKRIYPIESFDTDITHVLVAGAFFGSKTTALKTKDKLTNREEQGTTTFSKDIKAAGTTIAGKQKEGSPTGGGPTDGPPTTRDETRAGKRYIAIQKNDLDEEQTEAVKSQTHDDLSGSLSLSVTCPLIPEAYPNSLVRVEVMTGDPKNPIFKTVSGIYRIAEVKHTVNDSGGTTNLELLRGIGDTKLANENVQAIQDNVQQTRDVAQSSLKSFNKGLYG